MMVGCSEHPQPHEPSHPALPMDPATSFMSSRLDADADTTSLLKEPALRPYQAYCVTEASSRPPSPSSLRSQPLRIRSPSLQDPGSEPQSLPSRADPQTPATYTQRNDSLAILPKEEKGGNEQHGLSNQATPSWHTSLEPQHHITQAVTPRGSHPLTSSQVSTYDGTPSHLRVQQTCPKHVTASTTYRRKPLPQHVSDSSMGYHPLPPLPFGSTRIPDLDYPASTFPDAAVNQEESLDQTLRSSQSLICPTERQDGGKQSSDPGHYREDLHLPKRTETERGDITYFSEAIVRSPLDLHLPQIRTSHRYAPPPSPDGRSRTGLARADQPQLESSEELYIPRGVFSEIEDERRAHRRTQPKDAQLRYQFGHRPDIRLDVPPSTPLHRILPDSTQVKRQFKPIDSPRSNAYLDQMLLFPYVPAKPGPGPRPPPWVSSDNLEIRRQTRSDAREREDARKMRDSGSSIYKSSDSTESMREDMMRREVEEYREQVLRLYPDLEFDGKKNEGEGCCWCLCAVM